MEELAELLFEISSSDRLTLLWEIKSEKFRVTQLAEKLSATVQETSRHLARLSDSKLIEKNSDGLYILTVFGRLALHLLPSFIFLSKNRDYCLSHDMFSIPSEFIQRIGELSEHEYVNEVDRTVSHIGQVLKEAEQYIWLISDKLGAYIHHSVDQNHPEKTSLRLILPRSIKPEVLQYSKSS